MVLSCQLVAVQSPNGELSFRDAIDKAALILGGDGWSITEVKQCAFVGGDQGGNTIFQVIVTARETENMTSTLDVT